MAKRKDPLVLPADTGMSAAVMDTQEYKDKIKAMLADERVYKRLKCDLTRGYNEKLVALLTGLKNQVKISLEQ